MSDERAVEVKSINDLPAPVDGVITLEPNVTYTMDVNLGAVRLAVFAAWFGMTTLDVKVSEH